MVSIGGKLLLKRSQTRSASSELPRIQAATKVRLLTHVERSPSSEQRPDPILRSSAIGKKNWLFIGHPDAGQRSAIIYSVVVSCQRHGKDPLAYLRDVLSRLPRMTNQDDIAALTPARWSAS